MTTDHQVIVIGSGLGSLVTAVTLQRHGYDVTVIERQHQCGGCMQSFQRAGYQWDTGLHYVGALDHGQTLGEIFRTLGLMDLPWQRLDADAFDRIYMPAGQYTFSCGYEQFADNLARQFPHQREALHSYVQTLRNLAQIHGLDTPHTTSATPQTPLPNPQTNPPTPPKTSPLDTPSSALEALSRGAWPYLEETFQDPVLRQVVSAAAMRLELHRDTLPLFTFAHNNAGFIQSAWRLAAPGRSLVDHLLHTLQQAGGHLLRDLAVTTITEDQGHVSGCITSDGRHHHAPIVVSGIHPALTAEMAATCPSIRPSFRRRLTRLDNTAGMITVQLLLHPQRIPYFNHNKYVYTHNDVWDLDTATDRRGILITCRPVDASASEHNPSPEASAPYTRQIDILSPMAWDRVAEWADTTVGHRPESYRRFKEREAQTLIDLAATVIPGLREAIAAIYISTPLTYRDYNLTPHGSAFGIRKDYHAPLLAALSATTPLPGLYLNGQSLMIHGVEGTTITAIRTAQQIMRDIE